MADNIFELRIITPERVFYEGELCNRIFHETDPVPMTEEEWQKQNN